MKIAVDAAGGDGGNSAYTTNAEGAVLAATVHNVQGIILVGDEETIFGELAKIPRGNSLLDSGIIEVRHASQAVAMEEHPAKAVLRRDDVSIRVTARLVKTGDADAFFSAGHSGATGVAALKELGLLPDIDRPAIAVRMSPEMGSTILLDAGATTDCDVKNLRDFAILGHALARIKTGNPRVGLLSIGEEATKGSKLTLAAYEVLSKMNINFVGNIDAKLAFKGIADVLVCDAFTGNVALKIAEGMAGFITDYMKSAAHSNLRYMAGGALLKPAFGDLRTSIDPATYGGAIVAGVNGLCFIGHGSSSPEAVANAIRAAEQAIDDRTMGFVRHGTQELMQATIA